MDQILQSTDSKCISISSRFLLYRPVYILPMVKVIIVGAGIGGLVLAQYLRKHGIEFEIFERDKSATARVQGWALALQGTIPSELSKIVPLTAAPMSSLRVTHELGEDTIDEISIYHISSPVPEFTLSANTGFPFLRVNRQRLREWLATDLPVSWDKRYTKHEVDAATGKVTVHFADGSSTTGDILIGADGVSSPVRTQLLDGQEGLNYLPLAMVTGELTLNAEQSARQRALGGIAYIASTHTTSLFAGLRDVAPGAISAEHYWSFRWRDETVPHEKMEHWTLKASAEERLAVVKKMAADAGLHEVFREILDLQTPENLLNSLILRDRVPERTPEGPVTLIGDSAHAMSPFRGQGANNAAHDALLLGRLIVEAAGKATLDMPFNAKDVIREYEEDMIPRATGWVLASRKAVNDFNIKATEMISTPINVKV